MTSRILLVEDDPGMANVLSLVLSRAGHVVRTAGTGSEAVEDAKRQMPDLLLADVNLPGAISGVEAFVALRQVDPALAAVFITGTGSIVGAVDAIRAGGFDYLPKPFDNDVLLSRVAKALEIRRLSQQVISLREEVNGRQVFPGIVGASSAMQDVLRVLPKIGRTTVNVLIVGESGTGKELIARNLHRQSLRVKGPFVAVNSPAVPANLFESEFFGHERGAFTDAKELRIGRFEQADGGTIFLDEVGELPLESQAKLLRILEDRTVTRVGGKLAKPVDMWVLAATNLNLEDAVKRGRFREDLYWRLNGVTIRLPPLRQRPEDIMPLVNHLIDRFNVELGLLVKGISGSALERLTQHRWPGNVRELANVIRRAMILMDGDLIDASDLESCVRLASAANEDSVGSGGTLEDQVGRVASRAERALIEAALSQHRGNRTLTAKSLGINRKTLIYKIRQHDLGPRLSIENEADDES